MTDTLLTTAQTNTDAGQSSESATDATEQTTDAQAAPEGAQQSQSTAEADGAQASDQAENEGEKKDEEGEGGYHGAPEAYADFTLPEGIHADEAQLSNFQELAKKLDLNQEGAQALIDYEAERQSHFVEQMVESHQRQLEQWVNETKQDKEVGGANFEQASATARQALEKFGDDTFKQLLDPFDPEKNPTGLGLGNHPALVRVFNRIGKAISEDQPGVGSHGNDSRTTAEKLYPTMK